MSIKEKIYSLISKNRILESIELIGKLINGYNLNPDNRKNNIVELEESYIAISARFQENKRSSSLGVNDEESKIEKNQINFAIISLIHRFSDFQDFENYLNEYSNENTTFYSTVLIVYNGIWQLADTTIEFYIDDKFIGTGTVIEGFRYEGQLKNGKYLLTAKVKTYLPKYTTSRISFEIGEYENYRLFLVMNLFMKKLSIKEISYK